LISAALSESERLGVDYISSLCTSNTTSAETELLYQFLAVGDDVVTVSICLSMRAAHAPRSANFPLRIYEPSISLVIHHNSFRFSESAFTFCSVSCRGPSDGPHCTPNPILSSAAGGCGPLARRRCLSTQIEGLRVVCTEHYSQSLLIVRLMLHELKRDHKLGPESRMT
jgi:hypothetical protein